MRNHLIPALGHLPLVRLKVSAVEEFIKRQADAGYAASTIRHNLFVLAAALNRTVKHQLITPTHNP